MVSVYEQKYEWKPSTLNCFSALKMSKYDGTIFERAYISSNLYSWLVRIGPINILNKDKSCP